MKKILMALTLVAGFLVPVFVPPPANAVTCGDILEREGDHATAAVDVGTSGGTDKNVEHYGEVGFKWCWEADGTRFAKVQSYEVWINDDSDDCADLDNWQYDPNALNWWNPEPPHQFDCSDSSGWRFTHWFVSQQANVSFVNVYAYLPANERCIGAEAKAEKFPAADEQITDVPTICFFS